MDMLQDPQYKTPDGSALRIWRDTAQNAFLSERVGRAIFDEVVYVEVISPGSRDSTPVFECVRTFAEEMNHPEPLYGVKYAQYKEYITDFDKKSDTDVSLAGTPLSQWPEMTRTMVASLKAQSVFTVEALASLPDTKLTIVGPDGRTWREKAKAYIENSKGNAYATALAADLDRTKSDLVESQAQVAILADQIKALQAAQDGRPAQAAPTSAKAPAPTPAAAPVAVLDPITGEALIPAGGPTPII